MALCLIVEDDPRQGRMLASVLKAEGYEVLAVGSGAEAQAACAQHRPEVILLDLGLPDMDGLELIPGLLERVPLARVVVITGQDSVRVAVAALRAGARHYLVKPWDVEELLVVVAREARAVDAAEVSHREVGDRGVYWGSHPRIDRLRHEIKKLAEAPQTPVLITGETGTGKEVIARELHRLTAGSGLFIALNCAAVPGELLESELFGHERGAFTGAASRHRGVVELARDGTLFLDEIAELSPHLQSKVLRFLQDFTFRRVGGEEELVSRCRIVAATHRDLERMQGEGAFRADLYFRLAVVNLEVPPLRERREDILPLANFLIGQLAASLGKPRKPLTPSAEQALLAFGWPGNIRQLRNRLERALVLSEHTSIDVQDMDLPKAREERVPDAVDDPARIRRILAEERWNVSKAARRLGVPRHWLRYRMQIHSISRPSGE